MRNFIRLYNDPWDQGVDPRQNFITNSTGPLGQHVGINPLMALLSKKGHPVAHFYVFDMGDIRHEHIHADAPANRGFDALEQNLRSVG